MSVLLFSWQKFEEFYFKITSTLFPLLFQCNVFSGPEIKLHSQMVWQVFLLCIWILVQKSSVVLSFTKHYYLKGEIKHDHGISGTEVFLLVDLEEMSTPVWRGLPVYFSSYFLIFLIFRTILRRKHEDACHVFHYLKNRKIDRESGSLYNKYVCIRTSLSAWILKHFR